ncbi:TetR/AcrR family transcriptional regulator [Actinomadura harenae]|uniref:TetR/AcrR family transcriptional regulator n=1 Tax=Actinomadura harenae TaxID=2483351 RepID=A0A3M2M7E7_9ACTN|nr:TetR/AcrR family transcriptional regulator [Actinomadura harenae]RMI45452.1 TetR/AcrR family transcriptional regulator [Actinomadura harenae]
MADIKHFDPDAALETTLRLFWRQGPEATGIQDVVSATGLSRSSLYATFGGKHDLYLAALQRYVEQRSEPTFQRLAEDERGLLAIADFFSELVTARCTGPFARWGCMVANAHAATQNLTAQNADTQVRAILDRHHQQLCQALTQALTTARSLGQLAPGTTPRSTAEVLALLAYGINLRSRNGADAHALNQTMQTALNALTPSRR